MRIKLNETQLADLNSSYRWWVEQTDEAGRIIGLGGRWRYRGINGRVLKLQEFVDLAGRRVLEPGCLDGSTTASLCAVGAKVTAFDVRPMNVARAFARCLAFGYEPRLLVQDVREIATIGQFDVLCHFGLFYHLPDPVSHFRSLADVAPVIALETHTAKPGNKPGECNGYRGTWALEYGWKDDLSGLEQESFWLEKAELLRLFGHCGWEVRVLWDDDKAENGPRSYYLLTRKAA